LESLETGLSSVSKIHKNNNNNLCVGILIKHALTAQTHYLFYTEHQAILTTTDIVQPDMDLYPRQQ
jgi:hypothetical protein